MFNKIYNFIFILFQIRDPRTLYYRKATVNGEKGCIQSVISEKMAKKFNAERGRSFFYSCFNIY